MHSTVTIRLRCTMLEVKPYPVPVSYVVHAAALAASMRFWC